MVSIVYCRLKAVRGREDREKTFKIFKAVNVYMVSGCYQAYPEHKVTFLFFFLKMEFVEVKVKDNSVKFLVWQSLTFKFSSWFRVSAVKLLLNHRQYNFFLLVGDRMTGII